MIAAKVDRNLCGGFMTRIRALGFSLKAFSTKLRRLLSSHPYRIAGCGILIPVLLLNSCYGCAPSRSGGPGEIEVEKNGVVYVLKEVEIDNLRFEPRGLTFPIQPAYAYWLKLGDKVAPLWATHEWHWERKGAMCSFADNASTDDCKVCDWCNLPTNYADSDGPPPCMGAHPAYGTFEMLKVVAYSGFIEDDNPQPIIPFDHQDIQAWRFSFFNNCSNRPVPFTQSLDDPLAFAPMASGLYSFWFGAEDNDDGAKIISETNGKIKIYVVEPGLTQQTANELTRQTVDGGDYWTWTMKGDPLWLENFSQNLRVTDIRIFKGACVPDPAQGKQCAIPNDAVPVKPSRILFLPDFQGTVSGHSDEDTNRCYTITPSMNDFNFINLVSCRERYDHPVNQTIQKSVTPAYDPADYQAATETMPEIFPKKLTWLVEFNFGEGADADARTPATEVWDPVNNPIPSVLIIEFTIKAKD
jgi:hypothetical protein